MSTQSQPDVQELYDALVYTGSKWRPWLWWSISGAAAGALGGAASSIVYGYWLWVIPFILVVFISAKNLYGLLERKYTTKSIQGTIFFPIAFLLAFIVPVHAVSGQSLLAGALVISGGTVLGCFHAVALIRRVRHFKLWMGSGAICGLLAAGSGMLVPRLANMPLGNLRSNVVEGSLVGCIYCALFGGALLWIFWDSSDFFARLAYLCLEEERLPEATILYGLAISIRPDDSVLHYSRGVAYSRLGQPDQAIADYDKALSLNPEDVLAYNNRGIAYAGKEEFGLALADFDRALSLNPNDASTFNNRGKLYLSLDDLASALAAFDQAIELDPTDAMAYSNRGATYSKLGDVQRAIEDYGSAIKHEPDYANSYANRAFAYYKLGEYERGIADCDQALALRPDHAASYSNRGLCHAAVGDTESAAADFRQALELPCPPVVREEALSGLRALGLSTDGLDFDGRYNNGVHSTVYWRASYVADGAAGDAERYVAKGSVSSMEVEYEITSEDLFAFQWRASRSPLMRRARRKVYMYVLLIVLLFSPLSYGGFTISRVNFSFAFIAIVFPIVALMTWYLVRRQNRRAILELLKEERLEKGLLGRHTLKLDEAGLLESTAVGESRTLWAAVDRVEQNGEYIFIYTQPIAAHIVPKRAFDNAQAAESFYQLARISKEDH
jgi:tetratricopeptide (TPR) repeat protein